MVSKLIRFFLKNILKNTSKFACQALKRLNPFPVSNIRVAY